MESCTFRPKLKKIKKIRSKKIPYISGNGTLHFLRPGSKNKKNLPWEKFLYSGEMKTPKKLIFSQKKAFLIF